MGVFTFFPNRDIGKVESDSEAKAAEVTPTPVLQQEVPKPLSLEDNAPKETTGSPVDSYAQLSSSISSSLDSKTTRANERARQRTLAPQDRFKRHQMKHSGGGARQSKQTFVGLNSARAVQEAKEEVRVLSGNAFLTKSPSLGLGAVPYQRGALAVDLEDLLKAAKVKKGKGMNKQFHITPSCRANQHTPNPIAGDFELIPHVGAVIVLDDSAFDQDDEWEHISSDESDSSSDHSHGPSYAQVVSASRR